MRTILYLLSICFITSSCNSQIAESEVFRRVNNNEWHAALSEADVTPQIVDVRTPEEVAEGKIDGAINIDFLEDGFLEKMNAALIKEETVYIYCRSGGRSAKAAKQLEAAGYLDIIELEKGYSGYDKK